MKNWITSCIKTGDMFLWLCLFITMAVVTLGDLKFGWKITPSFGCVIVCIGVILQYLSNARILKIVVGLIGNSAQVSAYAANGDRDKSKEAHDKMKIASLPARYEDQTSKLSVALVIIGSLIWGFGDKILGYT